MLRFVVVHLAREIDQKKLSAASAFEQAQNPLALVRRFLVKERVAEPNADDEIRFLDRKVEIFRRHVQAIEPGSTWEEKKQCAQRLAKEFEMKFECKKPFVTFCFSASWLSLMQDEQLKLVVLWFLQYELQKALNLPVSDVTHGFATSNEDEATWCKKLFCILDYVRFNEGTYPSKRAGDAEDHFDFPQQERFTTKTLAHFNDELRSRYKKGTLDSNRTFALDGLVKEGLWVAKGKPGRPKNACGKESATARRTESDSSRDEPADLDATDVDENTPRKRPAPFPPAISAKQIMPESRLGLAQELNSDIVTTGYDKTDDDSECT